MRRPSMPDRVAARRDRMAGRRLEAGRRCPGRGPGTRVAGRARGGRLWRAAGLRPGARRWAGARRGAGGGRGGRGGGGGAGGGGRGGGRGAGGGGGGVGGGWLLRSEEREGGRRKPLRVGQDVMPRRSSRVLAWQSPAGRVRCATRPRRCRPCRTVP